VIEAVRLNIAVAAQHVNSAENGAFTGEVSGSMLKRLGVQGVIIGHSERREMFGMTDEIVATTLRSALQSGLRVILCVGESHDIRLAGDAETFVAQQLASALDGVHERYFEQITIAYEPVWAIGTGAIATSEVVAVMISAIRSTLPVALQKIARVVYGGSVKPENAEELIVLGGCDGFLVGGASLNAEQFTQIVTNVDGCYGKRR
jgi:triosephosphate isomerase